MDTGVLTGGKIVSVWNNFAAPPRDKVQNEWSLTCALSMYFRGVDRDFALPQQISLIVFVAVLCNSIQSKAKKYH